MRVKGLGDMVKTCAQRILDSYWDDGEEREHSIEELTGDVNR